MKIVEENLPVVTLFKARLKIDDLEYTKSTTAMFAATTTCHFNPQYKHQPHHDHHHCQTKKVNIIVIFIAIRVILIIIQ